VTGRGLRVLLVSTLMLRAALQVRHLVRLLQSAGSPVRVVVGGAPFRLDPGLWKEVGADAMGFTASDALPLLERYVKELP
jgi:methanogenic corrinoid protein MtbC1